MSKVTLIRTIFTLLFISLLFSGCGDTSEKFTIQDNALTSISKYLKDDATAPTIETYYNLGIRGINKENIEEVNLFIKTLREEEVDSIDEIKAIVEALGFSSEDDTTPPVITINGDNPLTLSLYEYYEKKCATAIDEHDGEVTVYVLGEVNSSKVGTYLIKYSAVDMANNVAHAERTVYVVDTIIPDTTPPTITLLGSSPISLFLGDSYVDAGATATDDRDGDISAHIVIHNPVDTSKVDSYIVTYDINDSSGNEATQVTRTVNVVLPPDTTAPQFLSGNTISVYENQTSSLTLNATDENPITYSITGADADDFLVDSISGVVTFKSPPNYESGKISYTFTAIATDSSNNQSSMNITITILNVEELSGCWKELNILDINQSASAEEATMIYNKSIETQYIAWTEGKWGDANYYVKSYDGYVWSQLGGKINHTQLTAWPRIIIKTNPNISTYNAEPYAYFKDGNMTVTHWDGAQWQTIYSSNEYYFGDYDMVIDYQGYPLISGMKGDYDLHFKRYNGTTWNDLPWLHSGDYKSFYHPILLIKNDNNPFLITGYTNNYTHTIAYDYNGTAWKNIGYIESNITTRQVACASILLSQSGDPIIAYVEKDLPNKGPGNEKIYVKKYSNNSWSIIGNILNENKSVNTSGGLEGGGGYNQCISLAQDSYGDLYVAWQHNENGKRGIFTQKYDSQSFSWERPTNFLTDENKVRAPSLIVDANGYMNLTLLYDSTPNTTDGDDVKVYRCEGNPDPRYHINLNVLSPSWYSKIKINKTLSTEVSDGIYLDLNVTSHTNGDFMAIHTVGLHTFATTFADYDYYELEVQTSPQADHGTCTFIDDSFNNLGTYIYGKIEASDVNLTIDCSGLYDPQ